MGNPQGVYSSPPYSRMLLMAWGTNIEVTLNRGKGLNLYSCEGIAGIFVCALRTCSAMDVIDI